MFKDPAAEEEKQEEIKQDEELLIKHQKINPNPSSNENRANTETR